MLRVLEDERYLIQLDPHDPTHDAVLDTVAEALDPNLRAWLSAVRDQGDAAIAEARALDDQEPFVVVGAQLTYFDASAPRNE